MFLCTLVSRVRGNDGLFAGMTASARDACVVGFTLSDMGLSYVYILASKRNGTLYIGVTSDLVQRIWEHKNDWVDGFTKRYGVHKFVWYEEYEDIEDAIQREKNIKRWRREWKLDLIEQMNPSWRDLYEDLV